MRSTATWLSLYWLEYGLPVSCEVIIATQIILFNLKGISGIFKCPCKNARLSRVALTASI